MMKKIIIAGCALVACVGWATLYHIPIMDSKIIVLAGKIITEYAFEDDFEDNNLNKWTTVETGWSTTDAQKYSGTYSAYVDADTTQRGLIKTLPSALTKARITFYARAQNTDSKRYLVFDPEYALVMVDSHFKYFDGEAYINLPTDTTFIAETWYKIRVDFDASANSLKYWIDDVYKGEVTDIAFASVTEIYFRSHVLANVDFWVDDVKMVGLE